MQVHAADLTAPPGDGGPAGAFDADGASAALPAQLIAEPHAPGMKRVAVIDVGSNSVRLVVFDGVLRSPAYFYNEKVLCGLGASLRRTGMLDPEGKNRALAAIKRFQLIANGMAAERIAGIATAAVREASDGREFRDLVEAETGLDLAVASGEEEARLAGLGVIYGWPDAHGLACDIGGWSLEFAEVGRRGTGKCLSAPLGPLAFGSAEAKGRKRAERIAGSMAQLRRKLEGDYRTIYLVGGSWRLIAKLDMERRKYPLKVLNEYTMPPEEVVRTVDWIGRRGPAALVRATGTSMDRARLAKTAGLVLKSIVSSFEPRELVVSACGIREGMLFDQMPPEARAADPLIEACLHMERSNARLPGFGDRLFAFIRPLFGSADPGRLRLIRAACLLHDVNWRAHPDYRAQICFDNATRANLGGLDHPGRVFLGLALFHRYRNSRSRSSIHLMAKLLPEPDVREAEILGKAMRFGATFTVETDDTIGRLKFKPKKHVLTLELPAALKHIYGEVVAGRFASLAEAMDSTPRVALG